jgi:RNA polymerase sigma-70 factor, ECF subfamily
MIADDEPGSGSGDPGVAVERAFRDERAAVLATLIRNVGDFQLAEDAVQDAFRCRGRQLAPRRGSFEPGGVDRDGCAPACDRPDAPRTLASRSHRAACGGGDARLSGT